MSSEAGSSTTDAAFVPVASVITTDGGVLNLMPAGANRSGGNVR